MKSLEDVIKGLECCVNHFGNCENCPYEAGRGNSACGEQLFDDALDLLKTQEAVKPVVDIDTWKCGNCGHTLEHQELLGDNVLFHEQYNYCPECGKPVKWK